MIQGAGVGSCEMETCIPDTAGQCQSLLPAGHEDELPRVHLQGTRHQRPDLGACTPKLVVCFDICLLR